jgi:hypothetical protein
MVFHDGEHHHQPGLGIFVPAVMMSVVALFVFNDFPAGALRNNFVGSTCSVLPV